MRDRVVDFLKHYHRLTGLATAQLLFWLGLSPRKFDRWKDRYGKANEHNAMILRDHWLEPEEQAAISQFARQYPLEGYRRLTFMMLDHDIAAVSPATTYRVLKAADSVDPRRCQARRWGLYRLLQPRPASFGHWLYRSNELFSWPPPGNLLCPSFSQVILLHTERYNLHSIPSILHF